MNLKHKLKDYYPFKRPMELYSAIKIYLKWEAPSLIGKAQDIQDAQAVRSVALELHRLHPSWPRPPSSSDLQDYMQWCLDAEAIRTKKAKKPTKKPTGKSKMELKYVKAHDLYEKALKKANDHGKEFEDNDNKDVYNYIREYIHPGYKVDFCRWEDYLDRYLSIKKRLLSEIRTK